MRTKCTAIIASVIWASVVAGCGTRNMTGSEEALKSSVQAPVNSEASSIVESVVIEEQDSVEQEEGDNGFEFSLSLEGMEPIYFNIPLEFNIQNFESYERYDHSHSTVVGNYFGTIYRGDPAQYNTLDFSKITSIEISEAKEETEDYGNVVDSVDTPYGKTDIYFSYEDMGRKNAIGIQGNQKQTTILENGNKKIVIQLEGGDTDGEYGGEMKEFLAYAFTPLEGVNGKAERMDFPSLMDKQTEIDTAYDTLCGGRRGHDTVLYYGANFANITGWSDSAGGSFKDAEDRRIFKDLLKQGPSDEWLDIVARSNADWFKQQYLVENNRNGKYRVQEVREEEEVTLRAGQVKIYYAKVLASDGRIPMNWGNQVREQEVGILLNNGGYVFFAMTLGEYDGQYNGALKDLLLSLE